MKVFITNEEIEKFITKYKKPVEDNSKVMNKGDDLDRIKLRSLLIKGYVDNGLKSDFVQVCIYNNDGVSMEYEYLDLEELKQLRKFLNETIMKMTFKTTAK